MRIPNYYKMYFGDTSFSIRLDSDSCWMGSTPRLLTSVLHNSFYEDNIAQSFFVHFKLSEILMNLRPYFFFVKLCDSFYSVTQSCFYLTRQRVSVMVRWPLASERSVEQRKIKYEGQPYNSEIAEKKAISNSCHVIQQK